VAAAGFELEAMENERIKEIEEAIADLKVR
jgi:hypothetical protein